MNSFCRIMVFFSLLASSTIADDITTFVVIGDYSGNQDVADIVQSIQPDYLLSVGDNNYGNVGVGAADWESQVGDLYGDYLLGRLDEQYPTCLLYTSPSPRDATLSRMPSSA